CHSSGSPYDIHDVRIRYATYGITMFAGVIAKISHAQIGNVDRGFAFQNNTSVDYRNFLLHNVTYAFYGAFSATQTNRVENGTFHVAQNFVNSTNYSPTLNLTNCLLIAVTNNLKFNSGSNNQTNQSDAGVFQTAGSGARYLANSTYRNIGTTNLSTNLLAELKRRTTYAPTILTNDITTNTTLNLQVQ